LGGTEVEKGGLRGNSKMAEEKNVGCSRKPQYWMQFLGRGLDGETLGKDAQTVPHKRLVLWCDLGQGGVGDGKHNQKANPKKATKGEA